MINELVQNIFSNTTSSIVTPLNDISMVFEDNSLTHAMLILRESNYTQIPVLNYDKKFIGLISLHQIYRKLGEDLFKDFDSLNKYKVKDFVDKNYSSVYEDYDLDEVFKLLLSHNFINIVTKDNKFKGIITRSSVLKKFNFLSHKNDFNDKEGKQWQ